MRRPAACRAGLELYVVSMLLGDRAEGEDERGQGQGQVTEPGGQDGWLPPLLQGVRKSVGGRTEDHVLCGSTPRDERKEASAVRFTPFQRSLFRCPGVVREV
ncbi:hypothetical protein GCM10010519_45500 [Streptomyces lactacystinicus]